MGKRRAKFCFAMANFLYDWRKMPGSMRHNYSGLSGNYKNTGITWKNSSWRHQVLALASHATMIMDTFMDTIPSLPTITGVKALIAEKAATELTLMDWTCWDEWHAGNTGKKKWGSCVLNGKISWDNFNKLKIIGDFEGIYRQKRLWSKRKGVVRGCPPNGDHHGIYEKIRVASEWICPKSKV